MGSASGGGGISGRDIDTFDKKTLRTVDIISAVFFCAVDESKSGLVRDFA